MVHIQQLCSVTNLLRNFAIQYRACISEKKIFYERMRGKNRGTTMFDVSYETIQQHVSEVVSDKSRENTVVWSKKK